MLNSLKSNVNTIFIMLGNKCNFKCRYCLQHVDTGLIEELPQEINPDIYEFIYHHAVRRDDTDMPLKIHFFGGEPLVYFDKIKEIVSATEIFPHICYSTITNGSLFTDEIVEYFNQKNFFTAVSWDGYNSDKTRIHDIFSDPKQKECILKLNRLGLSAVLSSCTSIKQILTDFQKINEEYIKLHHYSINVNIDELFDTGIADRDLFDIDYSSIYKENEALMTKYLNCIINKKSLDLSKTDMLYIHGLTSSVRNYIHSKTKDISYGCCGNGISTLNLTLDGALYPCHNVNTSIGTIYDTSNQLLKNDLALDCTKEQMLTMCESCPVLSICKGGCKIIPIEKKKESYCTLKRAVFTPIINGLLALEKEDHDKK
jgi:uncharacterized protein